MLGQGTVADGGQQGIQFEPEGLAPEGIQLGNKNIRPLLPQVGEKEVPPLPFDLLERQFRAAGHQILELFVHLQTRQAEYRYCRGVNGDRGAADDEGDLVGGGNRLAQFEAAVEMTDAEDMLAVERDLHGVTAGGILSRHRGKPVTGEADDMEAVVVQQRVFSRQKLPAGDMVKGALITPWWQTTRMFWPGHCSAAATRAAKARSLTACRVSPPGAEKFPSHGNPPGEFLAIVCLDEGKGQSLPFAPALFPADAGSKVTGRRRCWLRMATVSRTRPRSLAKIRSQWYV